LPLVAASRATLAGRPEAVEEDNMDDEEGFERLLGSKDTRALDRAK